MAKEKGCHQQNGGRTSQSVKGWRCWEGFHFSSFWVSMTKVVLVLQNGIRFQLTCKTGSKETEKLKILFLKEWDAGNGEWISSR